MTTVKPDPADLLDARDHLAEAKRALVAKDSTANREWLEQARADVDWVLDQALEADCGG